MIEQAATTPAPPDIFSLAHAVIALASGVVGMLSSELHSRVRARKRGSSIKKEIREELQHELSEFGFLGPTDLRRLHEQLKEVRDFLWAHDGKGGMRRDMEDLKEGQDRLSSQVTGVNTQLEAMRLGIFRLVAAIKPEIAATLDLGGPIG